MCGIFGGGFKKAIDEDIMMRVKVLGLFNQSRGEHSCGMYNGEDIIKGIGDNKKFQDLAIKENLNPSLGENNVVIGHTRYATHGAHTLENAHPFLIDENLVLAHNGKIENIWEIMRLNEISAVGVDVDSLGLGMLINKIGYKALELYKGHAALLFHRKDEPNVLYAYHGASRNFKDGDLYVERPLFFLESEDGIYLSSMKEALDYIKREDEPEPQSMICNRIIKITNGQIEVLEDVIERADKNLTPVYVYPKAKEITMFNEHGYESDDAEFNEYYRGNQYKGKSNTPYRQLPAPTNNNGFGSAKVTKIEEREDKSNHVKGYNIDTSKETIPELAFETNKEGKECVFWWNGRYWRGAGGDVLCEGPICIAKDGSIHPIILLSERIVEHWFYRGIMLKDQKSYDYYKSEEAKPDSIIAIALREHSPNYNFALIVSSNSVYPVKNLDNESQGANAASGVYWWLGGKPANSHSITPKFSKRNYHFSHGTLRKITDYQSDQVILFDNSKETIGEEGKENGSKKGNGYTETNEHPTKVYEKARQFRKTYESVELALAELDDFAIDVLFLYAEDVLGDVMEVKNITDDMKQKITKDVIENAVLHSCTIEDVMSVEVSSLEEYIQDLLDCEDLASEEIEKPEYLQDVDVTIGDALIAGEEDEELKDGAVEMTVEQKEEFEARFPEAPAMVKGANGLYSALGNTKTLEEILSSVRNDEQKRVELQKEAEKELEEAAGDDEACSVVKEVITDLNSLNGLVNDLSNIMGSKLAVALQSEIEQTVEGLASSIGEILKRHNQTELALSIKNIQKVY